MVKVVNWHMWKSNCDTYFKMDDILKTFNIMLTQIYPNPLYYQNNNPHKQNSEKMREGMKERDNNNGKMRPALVVNPYRPLWAFNRLVLLPSRLIITRTSWWSFTTPTKSEQDTWATSVVLWVLCRRKELCFMANKMK